MAVVNTKSNAVTNADASQPRVQNPTFISGGHLKSSVGMVEVAAADTDASVFRMVRLPSNAVVRRIEVLNDAITGGTSYDLGLYKAAVNGGDAVDAGLFATAIDMANARTLPLDAMFETLGIEKIEMRLWELLGLSADPQIEYDLCFTANTVGSAAGTIATRVEWVV